MGMYLHHLEHFYLKNLKQPFTGAFIVYDQKGNISFLPNMFMDDGKENFAKMIFQGDNTIVAAGGNFYVGLCGNAVVTQDQTEADITDEPTDTVNGYAREALARNATDWPTIEKVDQYWRVLSKVVSWTGAGGDFDKTFTRLFLTDAAGAGIGGAFLFALSAPLPAPKQIVDTETYSAQYAFYL